MLINNILISNNDIDPTKSEIEETSGTVFELMFFPWFLIYFTMCFTIFNSNTVCIVNITIKYNENSLVNPTSRKYEMLIYTIEINADIRTKECVVFVDDTCI